MAMIISHPLQLPEQTHTTPLRMWAVCAALALLPVTASAVSLGKVSGNPVMGQPLALEVPLAEADNVTSDCVHFAYHSSASDPQYFPGKATIDLKKTGSQTLIRIHGAEFTQPVLEFRLIVTCGYQIARDYVLLPSPSKALRYAPVTIHRATVTPAPTTPQLVVTRESDKVSADSELSLNKMARIRYPLQPKARAKFKRMLRDANPAALEGIADNAPLPANADLQIPANIPKKRVGPYIPKEMKVPLVPAPKSQPAETPPPPEQVKAPAPAKKPAPAPVAAEPSKDRLTISSGVGTSGATQPVGAAAGALQEKASASFVTQDEIAAKLAQSESSYNDLKQQILAMESRMAVLEQERQRLQQEATKKSDWPLLETAVLILVGGLLGAMLMIIMQRRRSRSSYEAPTFDIGAIGRK